jgi:hypothetical protein
MVRETIVPDKNEIKISLPDNFVGKQVEFIAFINEEIEPVNKDKSKRPFAVVNVKVKDYKFNREEANER